MAGLHNMLVRHDVQSQCGSNIQARKKASEQNGGFNEREDLRAAAIAMEGWK